MELTRREKDVLRGIVQGLSNKEIGFMLGIGSQTVNNHTGSVLRKLGVQSRTQAAMVAVVNGLVPMSEVESTYKRGE
jgi:two-component system, NarL family, response regulator LiaR